jgi:hypothetical protein
MTASSSSLPTIVSTALTCDGLDAAAVSVANKPTVSVHERSRAQHLFRDSAVALASRLRGREASLRVALVGEQLVGHPALQGDGCCRSSRRRGHEDPSSRTNPRSPARRRHPSGTPSTSACHGEERRNRAAPCGSASEARLNGGDGRCRRRSLSSGTASPDPARKRHVGRSSAYAVESDENRGLAHRARVRARENAGRPAAPPRPDRVPLPSLRPRGRGYAGLGACVIPLATFTRSPSACVQASPPR